MTPNLSRRLAWALFVVGICLVGWASWLGRADAQSSVARLAQWATLIGIVAVGVLGLILAQRRPRNAFGWMFLGILVYAGVLLLVETAATHAADDHTAASSEQFITWVANWFWVPLIGVLALYPLLLFPTGSVLSPRWRRVGQAGVVVIAVWTLGFAFQNSGYQDLRGNDLPNPYAPKVGQWLVDALPFTLAMVFICLVVASAWSLVLRYRRGGDTTRAQLKWFAVGVAVWFGLLLYPGDHGGGGWIDVLAGLAIAIVPLTMTVAILRYRLFDIDRLISRTVSYLIVTAVLILLYAAVVIGTTTVLNTKASWVVAAATLGAAALAQPLYRRVQTAVDRRFDRTRYDQLRTVDDFGRSLRDQVRTDDVSRNLLSTVQVALQPEFMSVTLRGPQ